MKDPQTEALKLLIKLKKKAKANPKVFGENYGQKELREFEEKMSKDNVPYKEQALAMEILNTIAEFSPLD